jgi:hypothetical protein
MDRVTEELIEEERSIESDDLSKSNVSNLIARDEDIVNAGVTNEGAEFLDSTLGGNVPLFTHLGGPKTDPTGKKNSLSIPNIRVTFAPPQKNFFISQAFYFFSPSQIFFSILKSLFCFFILIFSNLKFSLILLSNQGIMNNSINIVIRELTI